MDSEKRQSPKPYKLPADYRSDRKSATGMSGAAKKGGRGGKFTWEGADGYTDEDLHFVNKNNSNAGRAAARKAGDDGDDDE